MYGVMYKDDDGAMIFKVCADQLEAVCHAVYIGSMGRVVTLFEHNKENNCYIERFTA